MASKRRFLLVALTAALVGSCGQSIATEQLDESAPSTLVDDSCRVESSFVASALDLDRPTKPYAGPVEDVVSVDRKTPYFVGAAYQGTKPPTFEIRAKPSINLEYPRDLQLFTSFEVVNGDVPYDYMAKFVIRDDLGNKVEIPDDRSLGFTIPAPSMLHLQAGESLVVVVRTIWNQLTWNGLRYREWRTGEIGFNVELVIIPIDFETGTKSAQTEVRVQVRESTNGSTPLEPYEATATVEGCVVNDETGRPIKNAGITIENYYSSTFVRTDEKGYYTAAIPAATWFDTGVPRPFSVVVTSSGYQSQNRGVAPTPDQTSVANFRLKKPSESVNLVLTGEFDTVLNINNGDVSDDGKYVAVVHYHSVAPGGMLASEFTSEGKLLYFTTDGKLLWEYPLLSETAAVDVNADGSLIASSRGVEAGDKQEAFILDRDGKKVWSFSQPGKGGDPLFKRIADIRWVRMSPDSKRIVLGSIQGHVLCFDIASNTLLWERFVNEYVRGIVFVPGTNDVIVPSADGYLTRFGPAGEVRWRVYTGGMAISYDVSQHFFAMSPKAGRYSHLIDLTDGKILWTYMTSPAVSDIDISPDESTVSFAAASTSSNAVLSINGELQHVFDSNEQRSSVRHGEPAAFFHSRNWLLRSGQEFDDQNVGRPWLEVVDAGGGVLWRTADMTPTIQRGPTGGVAWVSADDSRVVVSSGSSLYFFKVEIDG